MSIKCLVTIVHADCGLLRSRSEYRLERRARLTPGFPSSGSGQCRPERNSLKVAPSTPFPTELLFAVHVIGSVVPLQQPSLDSPDAIGRRERRNVREYTDSGCFEASVYL